MMIRMKDISARRGIVCGMVLLLSGCDVLKLGVVGHAGPIAASQWHLYLIVGAVLVFVAGPVLLLAPIMAWHYRLSNAASAS
jgi:cytochrome o ubiquinol oxidase subunit 2